MNNAKKLAKHDGVGKKQGGDTSSLSLFSSKNKILAILGIVAVLVLCAGVCYMQLRPRPVLTVSTVDENGTEKKNTVYMKDAVYSIYQVENQYNQYSSIYQQMYGKTYWEMEDVDGKGRNGASAAKKQVMDSLKQREILYMEAQKRGYSLTDEEIKETEENVATTVKNFTDAQKQMDGLDEKTLKSEFKKNALVEKFRQILIKESGIDEEALKATVNKDDYRQYTLQYYMVSNQDTSGEETQEVSPEQKQTNLSNMQALQEKAKTAEDFTKLLDEKDTTGIQYQTENLVKKDLNDSTFLTKKLRKQITKMKNDEISDIIEGEDGYYLVKMVNNDDSEAYDNQCNSVIEEEETKQFNAKYAEFAVNYVTEVQSYWKGRVKLGSFTIQ
ncbi:MAG: peptidyl-prolyl cis-trans isomerase [Clostridiales bacterium]|nr:peptidyl-prolyl cis-trans isomerase [Clostridiales bacterium]